ncbi:MAG: hypothetical protein V3T73_03270 [Dehalococcoidales bacterium]|jgi:hypothetical protein
MQRCPNCGQPGARTEDWACQWCGYPLISSSYKKIPKTYKQLKEEILHQEKPPLREEAEPELMLETRPEPEPKPEPELKPETELEPQPQPEPEPEVEPEPELKPETELEPQPELELELKPETRPQPEPQPEPEPEPELKLETRPEPEPQPEPEPEMKPAEIEITVKELLSAYTSDGAAADARFVNKVLKIRGIVSRIEVNDILDVHYIILASADKREFQTIRCLFDKKHGPELSQLTKGLAATVQGKYDGSLIDIRMRDCVLAS